VVADGAFECGTEGKENGVYGWLGWDADGEEKSKTDFCCLGSGRGKADVGSVIRSAGIRVR
jgi:hypothetical protein